MSQSYSYRDVLAASERITWRVEDIIGPDKTLDFAKPFLPDSLAHVDDLDFLSPCERLALNQVRGHGYLCTFLLAEEFILPFVMDHARAELYEDDDKARALLQFASEEAKHIQMFKCFRDDFERGFGVHCDIVGPALEIAAHVLRHHPLAVALIVLHIEWMTQRHYVESIKDNQVLDAQFRNMLRHHWMEEAQHAKLDTLMIEAMAERYDVDEMDRAVDEYIGICRHLDDCLARQVELDMEGLRRATGRALGPHESATFRQVQHQALRRTYLGSGITHHNFLATIDGLSPSARGRIDELAARYAGYPAGDQRPNVCPAPGSRVTA